MRESAGRILGFENTEAAISGIEIDGIGGVGQLTSFNQLGFAGIKARPDGWYLPNEKSFPAIVLEAKSESAKLKQCHVDELLKNLKIIETKYKNHIGLLYNGNTVKIYKNGSFLKEESELKNKEYYLSFFAENKIDTQKIYSLTAKINNTLHFKFGIKNLYHRMIFTACALVAKRYGAFFSKGMQYETFHTDIKSTLNKSFADAIKINQKLNILLEVYESIKMNMTENQNAIDEFINCVAEISDNLNSDFWNGEDIMAIFFNEFNRYKGKSEQGQVFTPDHITSLMYKLININKDDIVLDAACGSGAFLVKAMCNMVKDAGGISTDKAKEIKQKQLYGIEFDREIYALACANFLIHKDGKTNLEQLDSRNNEAKKWIQSKKITKVLMNPPFENKYGCLEIIANVLESVERETACAFIMPDNKLEANLPKAKKLLQKHTLTKIVKLPNEIFGGTTTSVFIFKAGVPQNNAQIFACYIKEDGLETVKNQGRQDIKHKWADIESYWIDAIYKQNGDNSIQWLDPNKNLSYKMPENLFKISEQDFKKTVFAHLLFENKIDEQAFKKNILDYVLFNNQIIKQDRNTTIIKNLISHIKNNETPNYIKIEKWQLFPIVDFFKIGRPNARSINHYNDGEVPFVASGNFNNGVEKYVTPIDNEILDKGNCITISPVDGSTFYQSVDFLGRGGAGSSIIKLYCDKLNVKNALFLCTILKKICEKYTYSNMCSADKIKKEFIRLPVNENGNPDFTYMENYITKIYNEQKKIVG